MTREPARPMLVLGLGNILLSDEGVGVRVVESMERMNLPHGVELFDGATAGLDLLDAIAGRRKVIVIDAMQGDLGPGTVLRLGPEDLASPAGPGLSLHEVGLLEALAAAGRLGIAPEEVVILGVKPKDCSYGLALSPEIESLLPKVAEAVLAELVT
jgi:hydrogenase maturation protease